jgi:hypothetical protein
MEHLGSTVRKIAKRPGLEITISRQRLNKIEVIEREVSVG